MFTDSTFYLGSKYLTRLAQKMPLPSGLSHSQRPKMYTLLLLYFELATLKEHGAPSNFGLPWH